MAPLYATQADFEAYVEGWVTDDASALARYLERAERDVEALFPVLPIARTGTYAGHRFDSTQLAAFELTALKRAICAQAEYLIDVGPGASSGTDAVKVKGPDFEVEHATGAGGGRRRYSAKLPTELAPLAPYRARYARARA